MPSPFGTRKSLENDSVLPTTQPVNSSNDVKGGLEQYEREENAGSKLPFVLNRTEAKLLGIAGTGFFLDAYDLFIINQISIMFQYRWYEGKSLPADREGILKAGANIGAVVGQFLFGYLADAFGRKRVYGKELMIIIFATILTICVPSGIGGNNVLTWVTVCRVILGIGIGGDYPMSASVSSDRSTLKRRGSMLAYIFSAQGWGSLVGSIVTIVVLAAYKTSMNDKGHVSKVDGVWRIIVALSLVPAFGTLYHRLTLPEATKYTESQDRDRRERELDQLVREKREAAIEMSQREGSQSPSSDGQTENRTVIGDEAAPATKNPAKILKPSHHADFIAYFRQWRHLKVLIGTAGCWFLVDIAFYGINLNQSVVLERIGFAGHGGTAWNNMHKIALGNLIITALGFVPGYYATVFTIEYLGRKWIQIQGFLLAALFLGILAGRFDSLGTVPFIVCFALLQFFFNFGANSTTYMYPAEVFPTKFRASAHGISAASGKVGAIISSLVFNTVSKKIGTPKVLWIFVACCLAGAVLTLLLPEVKDRDPDVVLMEEEAADRRAGRRE